MSNSVLFANNARSVAAWALELVVGRQSILYAETVKAFGRVWALVREKGQAESSA